MYLPQSMCVGKKPNFGSWLSPSATGPGGGGGGKSPQVFRLVQHILVTTEPFHWPRNQIFFKAGIYLETDSVQTSKLRILLVLFCCVPKKCSMVQHCQHRWWLKRIWKEKPKQGKTSHHGSAKSTERLLSLSGRKFHSSHISPLFWLEGPFKDILNRCSGWPFETHHVSREYHSF